MLAALSGILLAGCGMSAADLPLPAPGVGASYPLTAVFRDALNLPEGAHVKLDGDDVGRVTDITPVNFTARVAMRIRADVPLPRGTAAELRQATPLGEVFVALHPPAGPAPAAKLKPGDTINPPDTATSVSIEDLLAALSSLINGGGLAQVQTIVGELNVALGDGRADQASHLVGQLNSTLGTLNARTQDIDRLLTSTRTLTETLHRRSPTIDAALSDFTPAIAVLADQTDRLTKALTSVAALGDTTDHVIDRSGGDIRSLARDAGPVLDGFNATRDTLAPSLRNLVEFGRVLGTVTKGEAVAAQGSVNLMEPLLLPGPGDNLPGPTDLVQGERSFTQHLEHQLRTFGGHR